MEVYPDNFDEHKIDIHETLICVDNIKEDYVETPSYVDPNLIIQETTVDVNSNIKEEPKEYEETQLEVVTVQEAIFLNNDMEDEFQHTYHCEECDVEYELYCTTCPMLCHLLDNSVLSVDDDRSKKTIPKNVLDFRETNGHVGVFALKAIPKGVKFGPFEGLEVTPNLLNSTWKSKGRKLIVNPAKYSNWMQYIEHAKTDTEYNLSAFQVKNDLYYRSARMIDAGEELLVYFAELLTDFDDEAEVLITPFEERVLENVFACTFCCLGFSAEAHLIKHRTMCLNGVMNPPIEIILEPVQCSFCGIFMDEEEYLGYHINYCCEKYARQYKLPELEEEMKGANLVQRKCPNPDCAIVCKCTQKKYHYDQKEVRPYACPKCDYKTNRPYNLKLHIETHDDYRRHQCELCSRVFARKHNLKVHMASVHANGDKKYRCAQCDFQTSRKRLMVRHTVQHDDTKSPAEKLKLRMRQHLGGRGDVKLYNCCKCSYKTNERTNMRRHMYTHVEIKPFICKVCGKGFVDRIGFTLHMKDKHLTTDKEYKCSKCEYQTNVKGSFKHHISIHHAELLNNNECVDDSHPERHSIELTYHICSQCNYRSIYKSNLKIHLRIHDEDKKFVCAKCPYKTNDKRHYRRHLYTHQNNKPFVCEYCNRGFSDKVGFNLHVKDKHVALKEKDFKCPKCIYQTSRKASLKLHMYTHDDVKPFTCEVCNDGFTTKLGLNQHTRKRHVAIDGVDYKCGKCDFQANDRHGLTQHLLTHDNLKPFECHVCKKRISTKVNLRLHIRNMHGVSDEKDYKCTVCLYQTNYKRTFELHVLKHDTEK